ncbi:hypothetical protein JCM11491_004985 [Sporobolomyces phaffii]
MSSSDSVVLPAEWEYLSSPREPEVKVWVTSGGKALPVFKKQTGNPASVSAEITGLEGKEFQVHFYDGRDKLAKPYKRRLLLDGNAIWYDIIKKNDGMYDEPKDSASRLEKWTNREDGNGQLRSLTFGKIPTTDDSSKATKESWLVAAAGTITVEYLRVKNYRQVRLTKKELQEARVAQQRIGSSTSQTLIDEASKKAASLLSASGLGALVGGQDSGASLPTATTKSKYDYVDNGPYLTFTFLVRSSVAVQDELFAEEESKQGIVPSKRGSAEVEEDEGIDNDDEDDESADIDAQIQALVEKKRAQALAKKKSKNQQETKPRVTPPPPFDWQGRPPIDMGKRIYVDYEEQDVGDEEKKEVEKEKLEKGKGKEVIVL